MSSWANPPGRQDTGTGAPGRGHSTGKEKANLLASQLQPSWLAFALREQGSRKGSNKQCWGVQMDQSEFSLPSPMAMGPPGKSPHALASVSLSAQQGVGLTLQGTFHPNTGDPQTRA